MNVNIEEHMDGEMEISRSLDLFKLVAFIVKVN